MANLRIALAQINTTVGDIKANSQKMVYYIRAARREKADIVVFPELALCGYPPEDLLLKKSFLKENKKYLKEIISASDSIFVAAGFPDYVKSKVFNAAALIYNKKLVDVYHKVILPNYGVFDERRYFTPGVEAPIAPFGIGVNISFNICEDIWHPMGPYRVANLTGMTSGIINISSSPYHTGKIIQRQKLLKKRAVDNGTFVCYCNAVGGQDELVFDGGSLVYGPGGRLIARAKQFAEELVIADLDFADPSKSSGKVERLLAPQEEVFSALVLGLKDYVRKNGFKKVVLGLSGGIDSALTAYVAYKALGPENVIAVSMPSEFSSAGTKNDALKLAKNLNIRLDVIGVSKLCNAYSSTLKKVFEGKKRGVAEENLQARVRGNILMALSNKFGWLVVTTGNKSEIGVGYCTLYGDTAGGFAVLKDVPKGQVYRLARHLNKKAGFDIIPKSIIKRAPSAELRLNQKDQDTLPPYPALDRILDAYIEKDRSKDEIVKMGFSRKTVERVVSMVDKNEYKRRQSPPGVKITPKAFGRDRRMPIVNKFS